MTDNRTTELQSLSKLKKAGKLRYWRGTIEIPESDLHAICDEIQAEYENAIHALNKAAGNWAKADAELREKGDMAMARATDELRNLLDERGVEYYKHEDGEPLRELHEGRDDATSWRVGGANVCAVPFDDYTFDLWIDHSTPEEAIAVTLGGERERELELLVKQLWYLVNHRSGYGYAAALESIEELGIEVEQ